MSPSHEPLIEGAEMLCEDTPQRTDDESQDTPIERRVRTDALDPTAAAAVADLFHRRRAQQQEVLAVRLGQRFASARQTADLTPEEAAERVGLSTAAALLQIEAGQALPPLELLITAAVTYGTTADFLLGLCDEGDRDPAAGLLKMVGAKVQQGMQQLARHCAATNVAALRAMMPSGPQALALAEAVTDLALAVDQMRKMSPDFDREIMGGARVLARVRQAADSAVALRRQISAAQRRALQAQVGSREALQIDGQLLPVLRDDFLIAVPAQENAELAIVGICSSESSRSLRQSA